MSVLRATATFEHTSGLPRDRSVNTFHFNGLISDDNLVAIRERVRDFYATALPSGGTVGRWLSNVYTGFVVRIYDVTDEPAGAPLLVSSTFGIPARNGVANLPSEVACCLSFQGTPMGGLVQKRRRGRIYIGALNDAALANPGNSGAAIQRPASAMRTDFRDAAKRLATGVDPVAEWVVYSRPYAGRDAIVRPGRTTLPAIAARPGTTVNIDEVWTDDAFDTQRRRGEKATARTLELTGE